jgi:hypothetical protein
VQKKSLFELIWLNYAEEKSRKIWIYNISCFQVAIYSFCSKPYIRILVLLIALSCISIILIMIILLVALSSQRTCYILLSSLEVMVKVLELRFSYIISYFTCLNYLIWRCTLFSYSLVSCYSGALMPCELSWFWWRWWR